MVMIVMSEGSHPGDGECDDDCINYSDVGNGDDGDHDDNYMVRTWHFLPPALLINYCCLLDLIFQDAKRMWWQDELK